MNKKPRVAFFTSSARGLAHYVAHLYPEIKKYVEPFYVTYSGQEVDELALQEAGKVYRIINLQSPSFTVLEVIKFLKENQIDLINLQVSDTVRNNHMLYFSIMSYAKNMGIPVCLTIHDVYTIESMKIEPADIELVYLLGDSFIVGNKSEEEKLSLLFNKDEKDIITVTHGPYTLFDNKKWDERQAKKAFGLEGKKIMLFFGQIRPNKGLKYLIKALPLVLKEHPDAHLYISTDLHMSTPELNDYLNRVAKSGVKDHVTLIRKYIPSSEIEKVFKASDVVVLPYTKISQSGVLNLALAFKRPAIVSDVFFEANKINNTMGYSFESGSYKDLALKLNQLFSLKDCGKSMGETGYKYAIQEASWQIAAKQTMKAFEVATKKYKK